MAAPEVRTMRPRGGGRRGVVSPPRRMDDEDTEGGDEKKAEGEKGRMLAAAIKKGDGEAIYEAVRAIME